MPMTWVCQTLDRCCLSANAKRPAGILAYWLLVGLGLKARQLVRPAAGAAAPAASAAAGEVAEAAGASLIFKRA